MKEKLAEFNQLYNARYQLNSYTARHIKQQLKEDDRRTQSMWQSAKSVGDVQRYINAFLATVKQYENIRGVFTDAYDMDLALYRVVNAI